VIDCNELVEVVTDYLENTMSPEDRARFDEHLIYCDGCTTYLDQMRATLEAMGKIPTETVSDQARERLLQSFRDWKKTL
jgi:predicted anti-sigma-YlaC factor YlaD